MKRRILFSISVLALALSIVPQLGATQVASNGPHYIKSWHPGVNTPHPLQGHGMCFHKKDAGWDNGNPIHLWSCSEGRIGWKTWLYEPSSGLIRNAERPDKCIHKKANNWDNGNAIHLWDCNAGSSIFKTWTYDTPANEYPKIRARSQPSMCLHKKENNWKNGNPVHLWDCEAGGPQMKSWLLDPAQPRAQLPAPDQPAKPDLVIVGISRTPEGSIVSPKTKITFSVDVRNQGGEAIEGSIDVRGPGGSGGIAGLNHGETKTATLTFTPISKNATYKFKIEVDRDNVWQESNESNNESVEFVIKTTF